MVLMLGNWAKLPKTNTTKKTTKKYNKYNKLIYFVINYLIILSIHIL
jgi:hypothetical protein